MRLFKWTVLAFVICFCSQSCLFSGLGPENQSLADTIVIYQGPKNITVQYVDSGAISHKVISYWTDNNGRPLYKKSVEYFVNDLKDGVEKHWNEDGVLTYAALWKAGIPMGATLEYYDNGLLKTQTIYTKEGFPDYQVNFHPNGTMKTDSIFFIHGKRSGLINYYDPITGKLAETYVYEDDELKDITIHNEEYKKLADQVVALDRSMRRDSIEQVRRDSLFVAIIGNINETPADNWSDDNNEALNLEYLEGLLKQKAKK